MAIITLGAGAFLAIAFAWFVVRTRRRRWRRTSTSAPACSWSPGRWSGAALLADYLHVPRVLRRRSPSSPRRPRWSRSGRSGSASARHGHVVAGDRRARPVRRSSWWAAPSPSSGCRSSDRGLRSPIPAEILTAIKDLPADAKLAYACQPFEELALWDARLLGIDARTGRRIVPMCFQAETFGHPDRRPSRPTSESDVRVGSAARAVSRMRAAHPSSAAVRSFLLANGIDYIYADAMHPNTLAPDATPVTTSGEVQILRLP